MAEASTVLEKEEPSLIFCDAALANGGGVLRSLAGVSGNSDLCAVLIIRPDIKPGHLKALKPWAHDYITTPVLREAAAARIRNVLRVKESELTAQRAMSSLEGWLSGMESVLRCFEPLSFDGGKVQDNLARRLLRRSTGERDRPSYLMIAAPDGTTGLNCDIYAAVNGDVRKIGAGTRIPESSVFLRIKAENGLSHINYFDRGCRLDDFQSFFPPQFLQVTGTIYNLTGFVHAGVYVTAFNYGRPATAQDALILKGFFLPGRVLGAVANDMLTVTESFLVTAKALALATDSQGDNGAHVFRMNEYARALAEQMALPSHFVREISYSAQLHDVGKICIHPDLLRKPIRLTNHEFELIKKHPLFGAQILGDSPLLRVARNIALTHHECWDGSGYPAGLAGESIPVEGTIVKIADVYDALRTMHTYKSSCTHEDACTVILGGGGDKLHEVRPSHFHPDALRAFDKVSAAFEEIYECTGDKLRTCRTP